MGVRGRTRAARGLSAWSGMELREGFLEVETICRSRQRPRGEQGLLLPVGLQEPGLGRSQRPSTGPVLDPVGAGEAPCAGASEAPSQGSLQESGLLFGGCGSRAVLPPASPYPASGPAPQEDWAGPPSPARDEAFLEGRPAPGLGSP